MKWHAKRDVYIVSTADAGGEIVRQTRRNHQDVQLHVPTCVVSYNKWMGGVDHLDQMRSYYAVARGGGNTSYGPSSTSASATPALYGSCATGHCPATNAGSPWRPGASDSLDGRSGHRCSQCRGTTTHDSADSAIHSRGPCCCWTPVCFDGRKRASKLCQQDAPLSRALAVVCAMCMQCALVQRLPCQLPCLEWRVVMVGNSCLWFHWCVLKQSPLWRSGSGIELRALSTKRTRVWILCCCVKPWASFIALHMSRHNSVLSNNHNL